MNTNKEELKKEVARWCQSTYGKKTTYKKTRLKFVEAVIAAKKGGVKTMEIVALTEPHVNKTIIFNILRKEKQ